MSKRLTMAFTVAVTARAFQNYGQREYERLRAAGCTVGGEEFGPLTPERLLAVLDGADAVIASTDPYTDEIFTARPRLKLVSRWGAGYESIDLAAATRHGVICTRVVGCLTDAVADHAFALLLTAARRIVEGHESMRNGEWDIFQGVSVHGATLGIIGFGPIGRAVAERARGFAMRVLVADPYVGDETVRAHGAEPAALATLLAESDFISLHAAGTPGTRHLIDAAALAAMKPTAILINTGRGLLVDEAALIEALAAGRIAAAALDTYEDEPLPADAPIRRAPRVVLTPHCAFNTRESALAVCEQACGAVLAVAAGRTPSNVLNPEVLDSPRLRMRVGP